MKEQEARKLIAKLTYEEKVRLNELLKSLEQMHQPFQPLPASRARDV